LKLHYKYLVLLFSVLATVLATFIYVVSNSYIGYSLPFLLMGLAIGLYAIVDYRFGFYLALASGFFIFFLGRLVGQTFPSAFYIDILIWTSFLGLILDSIRRRHQIFWGNGHAISYGYFIFLLLLLIESLNPNASSFEGWFFVFRKFLQLVVIYILGLNVFTSLRRIFVFLRIWITLAFIAGVYACYQEWFGFFNFEIDWVYSVPGRAGLYFLDTGIMRKFSILSDPAAFGILMGSTAVIVFVLILQQKNLKFKTMGLLSLLFIMLGVAYSGTRTAYFTIIAGLFLYILMSINQIKTLIFSAFCFLAFVFILFGPVYGNPTVDRIRSAFNFKEDASMKVRDDNRKFIQPYILSQPLGGGLATSGMNGLNYNPNHILAGFPPDSGFLKTAIETGWIGFTLQCILYFVILVSGVRAFYASTNRIMKLILLAVTTCVFSFIVSQFGQEAIGQVPGSFLFYPCLAIIVRVRHLQTSKMIL